MPLPKSLRRPVRRAPSSSTGQPHRKRCRTCNNLDPREHSSSAYESEAAKEPTASLCLVLDAFAFSKTPDVKQGGCRFCNVLLVALDAFFENWRGARARINVDIREKGTIKISLDGALWKDQTVEIYAGSASRAPWPTLGSAHHVPVNSGSDDTFNFIRRCIQDCLANPRHVACRLPASSTITAPKRLLDVGRASSPIRLVDTQGRNFQYTALSYCWGTDQLFTATKSNWPKLAHNIPFNDLPPLYQDAIIITRQLGLRYIWIDSLCIIQDSLRDWETESSKMSSIYQDSYATIAATHVTNGNLRCLTDRRKPVKIPYENTTKKAFALRARLAIDHHPTHNPGGRVATPQGPLTFRAWALQEHVLSTRILHYTTTEVLFECKTSYRCECLPERKIWPTTPSLIPKAVASRKLETVWQVWQHLVEQYSKRSLTFAKDKLPAISGIASRIREATHSEYFAGLWRMNLPSDLLWRASYPPMLGPKHFAPSTWQAPSFSWASLDTAVTYTVLDNEEQEKFSPTLVLLSSKIEPVGLNLLGALSSGSLTIRSSIVSATLCAEQNELGWQYKLLIKGTSAVEMTADCLLVDQVLEEGDGDICTTVRRAQAHDTLREFKALVQCVNVARHDNFISGLVVGISGGRLVGERIGTYAVGTEALQGAKEGEMIFA